MLIPSTDVQDIHLSEELDKQPLANCTSTIKPSELHISIGDNTKIIYNKKNVARKSIARKAKETRPILAPLLTIKKMAQKPITLLTPLQ